MAGRRKTNPAGSSNDLRGDVLRVLGVLKVATADQIQRIAAPHLSFRHTDKETPSMRKTARTAAHAGALSDLRKQGLSENGGVTTGGETLRNLTVKGLEAASHELRRPLWEMGGPARGAGSTGAPHPMSVNETVIALLRPRPDVALLAGEPPEALAAAQAAVKSPPGLGNITSYATEVPLPATGTWNAPGRGGAQADLVVTARQDGVPLLFVEVDNCHESAEELADKLEKYARFFRRQVKDTDGQERPMWRTRWPAPGGQLGYDMPHPPVLLVFHRIGARNPDLTVPRLTDLTRHLWQGTWHREDGFHTYDGKIPIIATGLNNLRKHGPTGPVFLRFGRTDMQSLTDAIGNPRKDAAHARAREAQIARQAAAEAEQQRKAEKKAAEREAKRPACAQCGAKFPDTRWKAARRSPEANTHWHPSLCEECESHARIAALQAEQDERERREQEEAAAAAEAARKAGRWLARFRT
ncbi:replication-relaxation family protein [Streptomyces sp. MI02-7b]|uniref:replication-relaxation family protein n=1 Tax=Streptomyces sp. MI02-7b TaxID=462941 RepID=UPI0029B4CC47|nr:replication-relaxation family protein [Streptomyces sp. MI02-7b]MDX3078593.1 replication-relaxation family protein [Streptomyces sp. MI02-7b]